MTAPETTTESATNNEVAIWIKRRNAWRLYAIVSCLGLVFIFAMSLRLIADINARLAERSSAITDLTLRHNARLNEMRQTIATVTSSVRTSNEECSAALRTCGEHCIASMERSMSVTALALEEARTARESANRNFNAAHSSVDTLNQANNLNQRCLAQLEAGNRDLATCQSQLATRPLPQH